MPPPPHPPFPRCTSRYRRLVALTLAVATLALSACSLGGGDVLTVNGWTLGRETFSDQLQQIADNDGYIAARSANGEPFRVMRAGTNEFDPEFVAEFLNERVTFQLAEAEVAERGLTVTDEDREKAIATIVAGLASGDATPTDVPPVDGSPGDGSPGSSAPAVDGSVPSVDGRAVLDAFGSYRQVLIDGVANLQVLQADLTTAITGDDQLRQLYDRIIDTSATQACVRHILVQAGSGQLDPTTGAPIGPTEDEYEAALAATLPISARLTAGEDFATVASEVSDDIPTRASGGDLGCQPRGRYSAAFDDAVWTQEVGVVGLPVRSEYGYHLILVTDRRTLTFDEMRDDLMAAVEAQSAEALQGWLREATRGATVTVDAGAGTWDAANGLVKAVGAIDAADLDLSPEDPANPSDDLTPAPPSTPTSLAVPLPSIASTTTSAP